jgi:hypothetical protein
MHIFLVWLCCRLYTVVAQEENVLATLEHAYDNHVIGLTSHNWQQVHQSIVEKASTEPEAKLRATYNLLLGKNTLNPAN